MKTKTENSIQPHILNKKLVKIFWFSMIFLILIFTYQSQSFPSQENLNVETLEAAIQPDILGHVKTNIPMYGNPSLKAKESKRSNHSNSVKKKKTILKNPAKQFDKWVFQMHENGVDIYFRWTEEKNYLKVRFDNTTEYTTVVSFKPLVRCSKSDDGEIQTGKHVFLRPQNDLQINLDFTCNEVSRTEIILDNLKIIKNNL